MADDQNSDPYEKDAVVKRALAFFTLSADAFSEQRKRELDDLHFQVPELQWTPEERTDRAGDSTGTYTAGIPTPPRPMISINQLDQPVQLVQGQQRAAHLGITVDPLDEKATDDTAEILQDHIRAIDRESNSEQVRSWAFDRSLKCGLGAYRLLPVYDERSADPWDQKILLKRILNPATVYLDPFATEPDFSDGRMAIITEDMPLETYRRLYPKSRLAGLDSGEWTSLGDLPPGWIGTGDDDSKSVRIAEFFEVQPNDVPVRLVRLQDGSEDTIEGDEPLPAGAKVLRERTQSKPFVKWCKINCLEVLEETEGPPDCPYIPILVTIGRELQMFDNKRRWVGMYTSGKGPQRLLNWSASNLIERLGTQSRAPWLIAEGQEEGHENEFAIANVRNLPYLRYKPTALNGQPVQPPVRNIQSVDISAEVGLIEQAKQFIQSVTAVHEPSLGQESSRAKSGRAILALQQQADVSTSGYVMNLAEITMRHEARILLCWIPYYYDRPGRIIQTVKADGTVTPVMLNQPFLMKNGRPQAVPPMPEGAPLPNGAQHYNLKEGAYNVSVTVGRSYQTRLAEGSDALGRILEAHPEMMTVLGPTWLHFQDWPGHDEAAELLKKLQPPQLKDENQPDPQQMQAENAQLKQAIGQLTEGLKQADQIIQTKQVEAQGKFAETQANNATREKIEQIKADLQILLADKGFQHELALKRFDFVGQKALQDDKQSHELGVAGAEAHIAEKHAAREMAMATAGADREDVRSREGADREDARSRESADREDMRAQQAAQEAESEPEE